MDALIVSGAAVLGGLLTAPLLMVRYRVTRPENALDHPIRQEITEVLTKSPMMSRSALRRRLGCSWGTVNHHLEILTEAGIVDSIRVGRRQRYFTPEVKDQDTKQLAVLRCGRVLELARRIAVGPGTPQKILTEELAMSRKVMRPYLDWLVEANLVREERNSRHLVYTPEPALPRLLEILDEPIESWPDDTPTHTDSSSIIESFKGSDETMEWWDLVPPKPPRR